MLRCDLGLDPGSLEARNGGRALHRQGCVLRGSLRSHLRMRGLGGSPFVRTRSAMKRYVLLASTLIALALPQAAWAQAPLTVYCSIIEEQCRLGVAAFERQTGIKVAMVAQEHRRDLCAAQGRGRQPARRRLVGRHRRSASAGGRGRADRGIQVADARRAARLGAAPGRAVAATAPSASISARSASATTPSVLAKNAACPSRNAGPTSRAEYKDEVQIANPNSSGTAYVALATLVQLMGEDKAFEYLKALHRQHQPVHQVGRRAGQGDGAAARPRSASPSCTTW